MVLRRSGEGDLQCNGILGNAETPGEGARRLSIGSCARSCGDPRERAVHAAHTVKTPRNTPALHRSAFSSRPTATPALKTLPTLFFSIIKGFLQRKRRHRSPRDVALSHNAQVSPLDTPIKMRARAYPAL
jgi:hypothetical protein